MIQITKWMNPYDCIWIKGMRITVIEWAKTQRDEIQRRTGKETYIKYNGDKIAIYRERLK